MAKIHINREIGYLKPEARVFFQKAVLHKIKMNLCNGAHPLFMAYTLSSKLGGVNCGLPCCSNLGGSKLFKVGGLGCSKFKYQYIFRYNQHKVTISKKKRDLWFFALHYAHRIQV